jgi:hypothetical protein
MEVHFWIHEPPEDRLKACFVLNISRSKKEKKEKNVNKSLDSLKFKIKSIFLKNNLNNF